jgi:hypothetical protein
VGGNLVTIQPTGVSVQGRSFSVRIRWQAEVDCAWELETHHTGFGTAEEAALFANGLAEGGLAHLRLERGELRLGFTDGSSAAMDPAAVTVWALAREAAGRPSAADIDFRRIDVALPVLSRRGLDGAFIALAYGVLDPERQPLDVRISLDEDLGTVDVSVATEGDNASADEGLLLFGLIPRA